MSQIFFRPCRVFANLRRRNGIDAARSRLALLHVDAADYEKNLTIAEAQFDEVQ